MSSHNFSSTSRSSSSASSIGGMTSIEYLQHQPQPRHHHHHNHHNQQPSSVTSNGNGTTFVASAVGIGGDRGHPVSRQHLELYNRSLAAAFGRSTSSTAAAAPPPPPGRPPLWSVAPMPSHSSGVATTAGISSGGGSRAGAAPFSQALIPTGHGPSSTAPASAVCGAAWPTASSAQALSAAPPTASDGLLVGVGFGQQHQQYQQQQQPQPQQQQWFGGPGASCSSPQVAPPLEHQLPLLPAQPQLPQQQQLNQPPAMQPQQHHPNHHHHHPNHHHPNHKQQADAPPPAAARLSSTAAEMAGGGAPPFPLGAPSSSFSPSPPAPSLCSLQQQQHPAPPVSSAAVTGGFGVITTTAAIPSSGAPYGAAPQAQTGLVSFSPQQQQQHQHQPFGGVHAPTPPHTAALPAFGARGGGGAGIFALAPRGAVMGNVTGNVAGNAGNIAGNVIGGSNRSKRIRPAPFAGTGQHHQQQMHFHDHRQQHHHQQHQMQMQQIAPVFTVPPPVPGLFAPAGAGTVAAPGNELRVLDPAAAAAAAIGAAPMPFPVNSFLQLNPLYPGLRRLMETPPLCIVDDFFSGPECDALMNLANNYMVISPVVGAGAGEISESRTSSSCFLAREDLPTVCGKVMALTGKPIEHLELPQVGRYYTTQKYANHWDAFDLATEDGRRFAENGGQRVCTVLVYLNDVASGGCTSFPRLGMTVRPKKGMAVVFFPATLDGTLDPMLLHAAEPAVDTKWVSQIWIRQGTYHGTPSARIPRI